MLRELLSLLEEAGQAVPDWFYQMIRQCTSAYRGGFGGGSGGGTFGRRGGHRAPGFGSRDMRSSTSMVSKNNSSGGYHNVSFSIPTSLPMHIHHCVLSITIHGSLSYIVCQLSCLVLVASGGVGRFGSSPDIVRGPLGKTSAVAQDDDVEDGW